MSLRGDFVGFAERFATLMGNDRGAITRLSEAIGASTGLISAWKSGAKKPSFEYIPKLADYFGVSTDYLFCRSLESEAGVRCDLAPQEAELLRHFRYLPVEAQAVAVNQVVALSALYVPKPQKNNAERDSTAG
jgi:transcriptional regulator with XRE-family HTH domain